MGALHLSQVEPLWSKWYSRSIKYRKYGSKVHHTSCSLSPKSSLRSMFTSMCNVWEGLVYKMNTNPLYILLRLCSWWHTHICSGVCRKPFECQQTNMWHDLQLMLYCVECLSGQRMMIESPPRSGRNHTGALVRVNKALLRGLPQAILNHLTSPLYIPQPAPIKTELPLLSFIVWVLFCNSHII